MTLAAGSKALVCLGVFLAGPGPVQPQTSHLQDPTVTFLTPGQHTVTLEACNFFGCTMATHTVTVLDPAAAIASATATPGTVETGRWVRLRGEATGRPPLLYSWTVTGPGGFLKSLTGAETDWDTSGLLPGDYVAKFTAVGVGLAEVSVPVTLIEHRPLRFYTVSPCRVLDTRTAQQPLRTVGPARTVSLAGVCGIPAGALAAVGNLTVVDARGAGHLVAFPALEPTPATWTVSYSPGQTRAVFTVLTLAQDGSGALDLSVLGADTDVLLDVSGYYVP
jgi:hypothetical protein